MRPTPWIMGAALAVGSLLGIACVVENVTTIAPAPPRPRVALDAAGSAGMSPSSGPRDAPRDAPTDAGVKGAADAAPAAALASGEAGGGGQEAGSPGDVDGASASAWGTGGAAVSPSPVPVLTPSAESSSAPAVGDFYACQSDVDCVAVRKVGCCNHGDKEAVNAGKVAAYEASFTCNERPVCAQFMRRDPRVAACSAEHRCEMVRR